MSNNQTTSLDQKQEDDDQRQARNEDIVEPKVPLQLTDVNDKCLLDIFDKLSVFDLLNVSDTNQRFKQLAETVWKRRPNARSVQLESIQPRSGSSRSGEENSCEIRVTDLKSCLQLLRSFGHHIYSLDLNCSDTAVEHRMKIEQYLSKYCSETLSILNIRHATSPQLFDGINKPFATRFVNFHHCHLTSTFAKLFPKMFNLQLESVKCPEFVAANLPDLKYLTINKVDKSLAQDLIRLNPQVTWLWLYLSYEVAFIEFINNHLPNLENLTLFISTNDFAGFGHRIIHFNNVTDFQISISSTTRRFCLIESFPFSFGKLKRLHVRNLYLNQKALISLGKIRDLETLTLNNLICEENRLRDLLHLDNILENVRELNIDSGIVSFTANDVLRFLEQSKSIQRFGIFSVSTIDEIRSELGVEWKIEESINGSVIKSCKRNI